MLFLCFSKVTFVCICKNACTCMQKPEGALRDLDLRQLSLWGWGTRAPLSPQDTAPGEAERSWRQVLHTEGNFFLNTSTVPSPTLNYFSRLGQRTRISSARSHLAYEIINWSGMRNYEKLRTRHVLPRNTAFSGYSKAIGGLEQFETPLWSQCDSSETARCGATPPQGTRGSRLPVGRYHLLPFQRHPGHHLAMQAGLTHHWRRQDYGGR